MSNEMEELRNTDIMSHDTMESAMKFADMMAQSLVTIPKHLRQKPADCLAITLQAMQWGMNPFSVSQKTHLINEVLGYEAQLVHAVVMASKVLEGRFHYEYFGDWSKVIGNFVEKKAKNGGTYQAPGWVSTDEKGCGIHVSATIKGEHEPAVLELLLIQATVRNSTLWASDPKQQLAYLAIKKWVRLHAPEVLLGVYTTDELQEIAPQERDITPTNNVSAIRRPESAPKIEVDPAPDLYDIFVSLKGFIATATNIEALESGGKKMATMPLEDGQLAELRRLYAEKKKELEGDDR